MDVKQIEIQFLDIFEKGFNDDDFLSEVKRYDDSKVRDLIANELSQDNIKYHLENNKTDELVIFAKRFISYVWVTSRFEKIAFQHFVKVLDDSHVFFALLYDVMYGDIEASFDIFISFLKSYLYLDDCANCAKWPIISAFLYYSREDYYPIKPTTTKRIASGLNYDISYKPLPNLDTYKKINQMYNDVLNKSIICNTKQEVDAMLYFVFN